jgi:hypothetical protein
MEESGETLGAGDPGCLWAHRSGAAWVGPRSRQSPGKSWTLGLAGWYKQARGTRGSTETMEENPATVLVRGALVDGADAPEPPRAEADAGYVVLVEMSAFTGYLAPGLNQFDITPDRRKARRFATANEADDAALKFSAQWGYMVHTVAYADALEEFLSAVGGHQAHEWHVSDERRTAIENAERNWRPQPHAKR